MTTTFEYNPAIDFPALRDSLGTVRITALQLTETIQTDGNHACLEGEVATLFKKHLAILNKSLDDGRPLLGAENKSQKAIQFTAAAQLITQEEDKLGTLEITKGDMHAFWKLEHVIDFRRTVMPPIRMLKEGGSVAGYPNLVERVTNMDLRSITITKFKAGLWEKMDDHHPTLDSESRTAITDMDKNKITAFCRADHVMYCLAATLVELNDPQSKTYHKDSSKRALEELLSHRTLFQDNLKAVARRKITPDFDKIMDAAEKFVTEATRPPALTGGATGPKTPES